MPLRRQLRLLFLTRISAWFRRLQIPLELLVMH